MRRLSVAKAYEMQLMRRESTLQQQQEEHQRRRTETVIEFTLADQRITTAFLWMLVLFVITLCIVK